MELALHPPKSIYLSIALEVGRRKVEAILILLEFGNPMKKSAKAPYYLLRESTQPKKTSCIVPAFIQYGLEFGETEIHADIHR